jgi:uncharacterized protein
MHYIIDKRNKTAVFFNTFKRNSLRDETMAYNFTFDLSKLSQALFKDIAKISEKDKVNEKFANMARSLVKKFNVDKLTGLPVEDSITIVEDLIHVNLKNTIEKDDFLKSNTRALFLPHCCRKYMDSRCKASFDTQLSTYKCNHCSPDCLVNKATVLAAERNYDIYVLPGGSGVRKIFQRQRYDGIVGVACTEELKLATTICEQNHIHSLGIPLIKNGCSETQFNFEVLEQTLSHNGKKNS